MARVSGGGGAGIVATIVSVAAAFHNLGAALLAGNAAVECDVLVCSDDDNAKQVAIELARKIPECAQ